jgi:hypothetical protein
MNIRRKLLTVFGAVAIGAGVAAFVDGNAQTFKVLTPASTCEEKLKIPQSCTHWETRALVREKNGILLAEGGLAAVLGGAYLLSQLKKQR